jgi:hypothetical protein
VPLAPVRLDPPAAPDHLQHRHSSSRGAVTGTDRPPDGTGKPLRCGASGGSAVQGRGLRRHHTRLLAGLTPRRVAGGQGNEDVGGDHWLGTPASPGPEDVPDSTKPHRPRSRLRTTTAAHPLPESLARTTNAQARECLPGLGMRGWAPWSLILLLRRYRLSWVGRGRSFAIRRIHGTPVYAWACDSSCSGPRRRDQRFLCRGESSSRHRQRVRILPTFPRPDGNHSPGRAAHPNRDHEQANETGGDPAPR